MEPERLGATEIRLHPASRQRATPVGRALYHNMDVAILRENAFNVERRLPCLLQQTSWGGRASLDWQTAVEQLDAGHLPPPLAVQWTARWRSADERAHHDLAQMKRPSRSSFCPQNAQLCLCSEDDWSVWLLKRMARNRTRV